MLPNSGLSVSILRLFDENDSLDVDESRGLGWPQLMEIGNRGLLIFIRVRDGVSGETA